MSADRQRLAEAVFLEAVEKKGAEREALLAARCGGDAALRAEVASLLAHADPGSKFLDAAELLVMSGAAGLGGKFATDEQALPAGSRIADYTLRSVLGSGGMGIVYIAEQERPRRTVALKVIRRGFGTSNLLRRFEHEAEVLGRLQHPGIAQIFEAGAAEVHAGGVTGSAGAHGGPQPFIAMELVNGPPLTEYAERQRLGTRERLALVVQVCDAVQHAHQRGVIHRDLKPANILVNEQGQPKVLDFGVARATDADLQVTTLQTSVGQLIGTLPYMSPEQVLADPREVDTRSDVYALGVITYQLLTGRLPHDLKSRSIPEAARVIRDEAPTRLSAVSKIFRGEIETIVAKALAKDKDRRYQSAADLAEDIRRFLDGRPIVAEGDSALYLLRKQLRRYRHVLLGAAAVFVGILIFAIYARAQAASERRARKDAVTAMRAAQDERTRADQANDDMERQLSTSNIERGRLLYLAGDTWAGEERLWTEHLARPSRHSTWVLRDLYARSPIHATIQAHTGPTRALALSPDAARLATGGDDAMVRLWDARSLELRRELAGHASSVLDAEFSPDGRTLATSSAEGLVMLWDARSGSVLRRWSAATGRVQAVAFGPDGSVVVTGTDSGELTEWDPASARPLGARKAEGEITHIVFSPDGRTMAVAADRDLLLFEGGLRAEPRTIHAHQRTVSSVAFGPAEGELFTGGQDRVIHRWDYRTGRRLATIVSQSGTVRAVAPAADGARLWAAGWWATDEWDLASAHRLRSFPLHHPAWSAVLLPGEELLLSGFDSGMVRAWSLRGQPGLLERTLPPSPDRVRADLSPDGRTLALGGMDGVVRLVDAADLSTRRELPAHAMPCQHVRFSPDGRILVTLGAERRLRVYSCEDWTLLAELERARTNTDGGVAFSAERSLLAFTREEGQIGLYDWAARRERPGIADITAESLSVAFAPGGGPLATVNRTREVRLFDVAGDGPPRLIRSIPSPTQPWVCAFSPDGAMLIFTRWPNEIVIWDVASRSLAGELAGHRALPRSLVFSPTDPGLIATVGAEGVAQLWDLTTRLPLTTFRLEGEGEMASCRFFPDGRRFLALRSDGAIGFANPAAADAAIERNRAGWARRLSGEPAR